MPPLSGEQRCYTHSPTVARERAAARKLGGRNRKREAPDPETTPSNPPELPEYLRSPDPVLRIMYQTISTVRAMGPMTNDRARTLATLARVVLKALDVSQEDQELEELRELAESLA